ncbi:unnamed protein product [Dicrocoelium dendriticum]|nr:unnamed protein product [Dicrocoelium dendriticum]
MVFLTPIESTLCVRFLQRAAFRLLFSRQIPPIWTQRLPLTSSRIARCTSPLSSSCYTQEKENVDRASPDTITVNHLDPNEWIPIYRFTVMPYFQVLSLMKFSVTALLCVGSPVVLGAAYYSYVTTLFACTFLGSTVLSLCSLAVFSHFSTKLIGVISIHAPSGLIRIGHLTFWGRRRNTLVHLDDLVQPADFADSPETDRTVRVGILGEDKGSRVEKTFLLTRLCGQVVDQERFLQSLGFVWE